VVVQDSMAHHLEAMARTAVQAVARACTQELVVRLEQEQQIKVMLVAQRYKLVVLRVQVAAVAQVQSEQTELLVMVAQAEMALHHL
jgi:hypothetical protein